MCNIRTIGVGTIGRKIKAAYGMDYDDYVKQTILTPAGISTMEIANNTLSGKFPNEVEYFGQESLGAYDMNVTRMDSHGGWIASATDLAKLLVTVDRNNGVSDVVGTDLLNTMYFGFENWWFAGSIPGTSAVFGRLNDDFSYVILTNTRTLPDIFAIITDMQGAMQSNIESRSSWPNYNLFK